MDNDWQFAPLKRWMIALMVLCTLISLVIIGSTPGPPL